MLNIYKQILKYRFCSEPVKINIIEINRQNKKQILEKNERSNQIAVPKSPILGPIIVKNPTISEKKYRWCSCGMSKTQPFCDDSHHGTLFKPYRFTIEQECDQIQLCGCKFTTNKPFCDGTTCVKMQG